MISMNEIRGALARGYGASQNSNKIVDPYLIEAMVYQVMQALEAFRSKVEPQAPEAPEDWEKYHCDKCCHGSDCCTETKDCDALKHISRLLKAEREKVCDALLEQLNDRESGLIYPEFRTGFRVAMKIIEDKIAEIRKGDK